MAHFCVCGGPDAGVGVAKIVSRKQGKENRRQFQRLQVV
jgi:hypothetical protein